MTWTRQLHEDFPSPAGPENHEANSELAPGVTVERRAVLTLPAAFLAAAFAARTSSVCAAEGRPGPGNDGLSWEDFLKEARSVAGQMFGDRSPSGQDAYLQRMAALAVRLHGVPATRLFPYGRLEPKVAFAPSYKGTPFVVIQWRMEPRAVLPAHCHPGASVCTLGLEGEARLRNFEVEGAAPAFDSGSTKAFLMRETHSQLISPGRLNTLSPARDNIHYFEAGPDGARGIDITTLYGGDGSFSFVAFEPDRPKDPRRRVFEASWKGMKP
jgi:hypothetical protein